MGCDSCKKKKENRIDALGTPQLDQLKLAGEYLQRASEMNDEKWDLVEDVYNDIYGLSKPLNRQCQSCLRNISKAVMYEYNKKII
jgi:hypothetical protein